MRLIASFLLASLSAILIGCDNHAKSKLSIGNASYNQSLSVKQLEAFADALAKINTYESVETEVKSIRMERLKTSDFCSLLIQLENGLMSSAAGHYGIECDNKIKGFLDILSSNRKIIITRLSAQPTICVDGRNKYQSSYWHLKPLNDESQSMIMNLGFGSNKLCGGSGVGFKDMTIEKRKKSMNDYYIAMSIYEDCLSRFSSFARIEQFKDCLSQSSSYLDS